jgi:hypothetical protein
MSPELLAQLFAIGLPIYNEIRARVAAGKDPTYQPTDAEMLDAFKASIASGDAEWAKWKAEHPPS